MTTIRADAHRPEFHRAAPPQLPVRVASTANVTIATALNAGDTIDGVTLAAGDRVLLKNQSTGAENGIYIAGATPERAFDMLEGVAAYGAVIYVVAGTAGGGKTFVCTNTTVPTIDTTALTFADYTPGGSSAPTTADYLVGTSQAGLSAEIVVGTTPGGELGNTWASPTVDATHSGSAHADFIAKSVLTTQDDIIVRDASAPARLAKGSDGQVLTVDPTTHHLVWATPAASISGIGVKEAGSTVVASATALDFTTAGFDVTSPGGGVAAIALDPTEVNVTAFAYPGGTTNFLRSDGTFADPGVPAGTSFNQAVYGSGSDGNVTIAAGTTTLTRDMYYNDLTVTGTLKTAGYRVFVKGTLSGAGTIDGSATTVAGSNGGNGTGAAGGGAGAAGASTASNNLGRGAAGTIGRVGGFNAVGLNGTAGQRSTMNRNNGTGVDHAIGAAGGAGANAGGSGAAAQTGVDTYDPRPVAYPSCVEFREIGSTTAPQMDGVTGKACGSGSGGGSTTGGGGGSGGAGAGGQPVVVVAKVWSGTVVVQSNGGNGGNGGNGFASSGSNGGGAGGNGGSGGLVVAIYSDRSGWTGSISVAGGSGGTHGNGNGGGSNGADGAGGPTGYTYEYRIS